MNNEQTQGLDIRVTAKCLSILKDAICSVKFNLDPT